MANEMDIDNILENDMINALEGVVDINLLSEDDELLTTVDDIKDDINEEIEFAEKKEKSISIDSSNIDDITSILKELLNNKTLEITIKLKDN